LPGLLVGINGINDNISDLAEYCFNEAHHSSLLLQLYLEDLPGRRIAAKETRSLPRQKNSIGQRGGTSMKRLVQTGSSNFTISSAPGS
jgi:hypothetical protein